MLVHTYSVSFFFLWFWLWLLFWFYLFVFSSSFLFCDDYTVEIQVSTIEVRYEHLNVEAEPYEHLNVETEPYARSKAVLTFSNFVVDILEFSFSKYFNCRIKIEKKKLFLFLFRATLAQRVCLRCLSNWNWTSWFDPGLTFSANWSSPGSTKPSTVP